MGHPPFCVAGKTRGKRVVRNIAIAPAQVKSAFDGAIGMQLSTPGSCDILSRNEITYISIVEMYVISQNPSWQKIDFAEMYVKCKSMRHLFGIYCENAGVPAPNKMADAGGVDRS